MRLNAGTWQLEGTPAIFVQLTGMLPCELAPSIEVIVAPFVGLSVN